MTDTLDAPDGPSGWTQPGDRTTLVLAFVAVVLHAALVLGVGGRLDPTYDEARYLNAGWAVATDGFEHPITWEHGPLPYYANQLFLSSFPPGGFSWKHEPEDVPFPEGRRGTLLFGILAAAVVFVWARSAFGNAGGLLALCLYALNPLTIGFASLALIDVPLAGTALLACYLTWRFLTNPGWGRAVAVGIGLGIALATKFLAVLVAPVVALVAAVGWWRRERRVVTVLGGTLAIALCAFATLYATYGFRVGAAPGDSAEYESTFVRELVDTPVVGTAATLLPAPFLQGIDRQKKRTERAWIIYLNGDWAPGHGDFYFWTFLFKTPELVLVLSAWLLLALVMSRRRGQSSAAERATLFVLVPVGLVYFVFVSFFSSYQVGVRYVMPLYPLLFVLLGSLAARGTLRIPSTRVFWAVLVLVAGTHAWALSRSWPNPIAYYNAVSGGQAEAWRHFRRSNSDNGQWMRTGMAALRASETEPFFEGGWRTGPRFGRIAVNVHDLNHVESRVPVRASLDWLEPLEPVANAGACWWIFDATPAALEAAVEQDPGLRGDLIVAYLGAGDVAGAERHLVELEDETSPLHELARLVRAAPAEPKARLRGWIDVGRFDRVLAELEDATILAGDPERKLLLAEAYAGRVENQAGIDSLESVSEPAWPVTRLLVSLYLREARYDDAFALLAASPDPKAPRLLERLRVENREEIEFVRQLQSPR